jgi:hypothetical protein
VLSKQLRRADKGGPPTLGLGEVLTTPYYKKQLVTKCYTGPWN